MPPRKQSTGQQIRCGVYARKSTEDLEAAEGQLSHSVDAQLKRCYALAKQLGWTVVEVYPEDDTSAFKKRVVTLPDGRRVKRNVRPLWNRLLDDLYHGRITALIAYDLDRSMREPRDLEDLIEVVEQQHRVVQSVTGSLRLSNDAEILTARIGVAVANKSSRDTSRRVRESVVWRVEKGRWHGGSVPFGYRVTGGTKTKLGNGRERVTKGHLTIDPTRARRIRDAAARVLAGESLYSITEEWNTSGFLTQFGKHWRTSTLAALLVRPSLIGMRERDGELHPAGWKAILTPEVRSDLMALFSDPSRQFQPAGMTARGGKHALGGLVLCSCGKRMIAQTYMGKPRLICHKQATGGCGGPTINYEPLEAFVLDLLFASLDSREWRRALARKDSAGSGEDRAVRAALADLDRQRRAVGDAVVIGAYTKAEAEGKLRDLDAQREKLAAQLRGLAAGRQFESVRSSEDAREVLESGDVVTQRAMLSRFIGAVKVSRLPAGMCAVATRRKGESLADFEERRRGLERAVLRARVDIDWLL